MISRHSNSNSLTPKNLPNSVQLICNTILVCVRREQFTRILTCKTYFQVTSTYNSPHSMHNPRHNMHNSLPNMHKFTSQHA